MADLDPRAFLPLTAQAFHVLLALTDRQRQLLDQLEQLYGNTDRVTGVPTGYTDLDDLLLGLQPSNLVVLAARPAAGKTAFALGAAANVAMAARRPVLFFSMEMGTLELTMARLRAGSLDEQLASGADPASSSALAARAVAVPGR